MYVFFVVSVAKKLYRKRLPVFKSVQQKYSLTSRVEKIDCAMMYEFWYGNSLFFGTKFKHMMNTKKG